MNQTQRKADFTGQTIFVGMDVHLKSWNVSLFYQGQYLRSFQQPPEPQALVGLLKRDYPGATYQCAYEAGFCGFWIQRALKAQGLDCIVVNPADVPQTDKGLRYKNDRNDSKRIAEHLKGGSLKAIYVPDTQIESDRRLIRYRRQIQQDLTRYKVRIKSILHHMGIALPPRYQSANWSGLFLQWLKTLSIEHPTTRYTLDKMIAQVELLRKELLELNRQLRQLIKEHRYCTIAPYLMSVPGVGSLTTITLLAEIVDIRRFPSFISFNNFIGFCPTQHDTGDSDHKGSITPRHHKELRTLLIEAAWIAVRRDPALTQAFSELKKRMTAKRAIIRIARKLLNRIWHVWNKNEFYENGLIQ